MANFAKSITFSILLVALFLLSSPQAAAHGGGSEGGDHGNADGANLQSRGLILVKIWCLIIMFMSTFAAGVSPYFWRWHEGFLLLGTQFAGGVFLGTALMHFLSDSAATFGDLTGKTYPFAYMLAAAGYLLTMMGDCLIAHVVAAAARGRNEVRSVESEVAPAADVEDHGGAFLVNTTSVGDTVLLILALCFHSIFEGIAVGVAAKKADAWRNMWTISLHKVFAAIAMGIALLKMIPKRPFLSTVAYSFAFAISSPIGVGIGIALDATTQGHTADWTYAITMGLACGVFVYVAINHLMAKGFRPKGKCYLDTPLYKLLAVVLGVGVISVVIIWD